MKKVTTLEKSLDIFKKIQLSEKRRALKTIRKAWQEGNVLDAVEPIAGIGAELFCTLYLLNRKQRPSKKRIQDPDAGISPCTEATENQT